MSSANGKNGKPNGSNGMVSTGGLRGLLNGGADREKEGQKLVDPLRDQFPFVAELLGGIPEKGSDPAVPGGTITFFVHEGRIRFSANVKGADKTFIGEVGDILNPWGSINSAFLVGDVSSKRYTGQKDSKLNAEQAALIY